MLLGIGLGPGQVGVGKDLGRIVESKNRQANWRSLLPIIFDILEVVIEKFVEIVGALLGVQIVPLLGVVDGQPDVALVFGSTDRTCRVDEEVETLPFFIVKNLFKASESTKCVKVGRVTAKDIGGNLDLGKVGALIVPVRISFGIAAEHCH